MTRTTDFDLGLLNDRVMAEGQQARGLPRQMFTSPELFELEQERLFHRTWACIGFAQDVSKPGDVCPIDFAGLPLVLTRDKEGALRVFHNVCPHRGMRIVRQAENRQRLVCPYHCWTFDLQGQLLRRPYFEGPQDTSGKATTEQDSPKLTQVRSARWLDAVFVNIDGKAAPFDEYLRAFNEVASPYGDLSVAEPCGRLDYEIGANWKLVAENFVDSYHVQWMHPGLQKSTPMTSYEHEVRGNLCIGRAPIVSDQPGYGSNRLATWPGLAKTAKETLTYVALFPNLLVVFTSTRLSLFWLNPQAPDRTIERINLYMPESNDAELASDHESFKASYAELNEEDIWLVEELQRNRRSPAFDGGRFSPHWDRITHHFAKLVAGAICQ